MNEKPSAKVRAIAGRVLKMAAQSEKNREMWDDGIVWSNSAGVVTVAHLKSLAGFVLNASPDQPKAVKRVKK